MRQVYKGGDKLFVDYCSPTIPVRDLSTGETVAVQIFVACLGASNYTFAEAAPTQGIPHWIGSHQRALEFFGGVPAVIVPDNLKSGVTSPCRYEPGINRTYQDFAEHYQVAVMPAHPHKPRDKAKVEKAVQKVERQILAKLRHQTVTSFSQLNDAIWEHLATLNEHTMQGYGLSRQTLFERVDQPELKPLPTHPFILAYWKEAKVNLDYHIEVERHYYSVPYWLVRYQVTVKRTENLIEIFHDHQRIALHERSRIPHRHSTKPEHMPPEHWAYKSQSKEQFLAWAQRIGPHTTQQVEAIFDRKPYEEQAFRTLKGVQRLATDHGAVRLEAACHRANTWAMVGLRHLRSMLKTHLETAPLPVNVPHIIPDTHANVCGQDYYS
ncbi:MAG: IS21 family transposase [Thermosynechococcaceae cyanobacterium]